MKIFFKGVSKLLNTFFNLRFLPDQIQSWLFSTGTRALEVTNVLIMIGWAIFLYADGERMLVLKPYEPFYPFGATFLSGLFASFSLIIFVGIIHPSRRGLLFKGYTMLLSSAVWALVSTGFVISYPPLTTSMIVYPVLAAMCWLCGENLIQRSKEEN